MPAARRLLLTALLLGLAAPAPALPGHRRRDGAAGNRALPRRVRFRIVEPRE